MDEISDSALITNSERNGGKIVLESGTYHRQINESPVQFLARVKGDYIAWYNIQEAKKNRGARDSARLAQQESPLTSAGRVFSGQSNVQKVETSLEEYLESEINRLVAQRDKLESERANLNAAIERVIGRLNKASAALAAIKEQNDAARNSPTISDPSS